VFVDEITAFKLHLHEEIEENHVPRHDRRYLDLLNNCSVANLSRHPVYGPRYEATAQTILPQRGVYYMFYSADLRYKSEGRMFDSRWCHWNFSLT